MILSRCAGCQRPLQVSPGAGPGPFYCDACIESAPDETPFEPTPQAAKGTFAGAPIGFTGYLDEPEAPAEPEKTEAKKEEDAETIKCPHCEGSGRVKTGVG